MEDILAKIVAKKKDIVAAAKAELSLSELKKEVRGNGFRFSKALKKSDWALIAECKLQSPAKGRLCQAYTVDELANIYNANGATMLSVHTDPHFLGKNEDLQRVAAKVDIPVMRKEFVIDEYQLYEARKLGASAVLLIARILSPQQLKEYVYTAWELEMDVLLEVHDEADIKAALATPAKYIGVNNRNLKTFQTSIENTMELMPLLEGQDRIIVSESGINTVEDALRLKQAGCRGILVGEGLVRSEDIAAHTRALAGI